MDGGEILQLSYDLSHFFGGFHPSGGAGFRNHPQIHVEVPAPPSVCGVAFSATGAQPLGTPMGPYPAGTT